MKTIMMALSLTLLSQPAFARSFSETETANLVCASFFWSDSGVGCVSKASIEKDKLQVELLKLQIQELKDKAQEKAQKESKTKKK